MSENVQLFDIEFVKNQPKPVPNIQNIFKLGEKRGFMVHHEQDEFALYQLRDNYILHRVYANDLVKEVDNYIKTEYGEALQEEYSLDTDALIESINKFGRGRIFSQANWVNLPAFEKQKLRHTKSSATFYFLNGFVVVTKDGQTLYPYSKLKGKILHDQIIKHNYEPVDMNSDDAIQAAPRGANFKDFLGLITSDISKDDKNPVLNEEKFVYLLQLLGFLLHDYRLKGRTDFCVIFCDNEEGGTGKGLMIQALEKLTDVCTIDGKNDKKIFDPKKLTENTRIKVYNDISKAFRFENTYNEITDGGTIHYKNGHEILLSYEDTPKILITANHIIQGNKGADRRRQKILDVTPFFNEHNTVSRFFKHSFFSEDWSQADWNYFYNTMLFAVEHWLSCDYNPVFIDPEFDARRIEEQYPELLRKYLDNLKDGWHSTGQLFTDFMALQEVKENRFLRDMKSTNFGRVAFSYLKESGRNPVKNSQRTSILVHKAPKKESQPEKLKEGQGNLFHTFKDPLAVPETDNDLPF